jgi:hypothetical protein
MDREVFTMEITYNPTKPIVETMNEARENFKNAYGRLLTEDEAIQLTTEIRKNLKKEGKLDED